MSDPRPAFDDVDTALAGAAETLRSWSRVFRDDGGGIVAFGGLALSETPHRIRMGDVDLHAWCAWDPLFSALIVGDLGEALDSAAGAVHRPATD